MDDEATRGRLADLALALGLVALALVVRWPERHDVPRYTDETGEVATAYAIAFDGVRPLTHNDAYRGPAWPYLVALPLRLGDGRPEIPRLVALLLTALTVGATYALGRTLGARGPRPARRGRIVGITAGLLQATAFAPVVMHSHIAWSNHSTPLWTTLAALALYRAAVDGPDGASRAGWWLTAGALWGLALNTHPSVVAPLGGAALWLLAAARRRAWLRTPGPWLAALAFVLLMSPLVVYNLGGGVSSVAAATGGSQPIEQQPGPVAFVENLTALAGQLGRAAGAGAPAEPGDPTPDALVRVTDRLRPPATVLYAALLLGALARAARRRPRLPAMMASAALVALPLINDSYRNPYDMRYLGFLLPLGYVALGDAAAARLLSGARLRRTALGVVVAALALYPLLTIGAFYTRAHAAGATNAPYRALATRLAAEASGEGHHVFIDKGLRPLKIGGGGTPGRAIGYLLRGHEVAHDEVDLAELRWFLTEDGATTFWVVAADETAAALGAAFELRSYEQGDGWQVVARPGTGAAGRAP